MKIGFYSDLVLHDDIMIDGKIERKLLESNFNCANLECPIYTGEKGGQKRGICLYSKAKDVSFLKKYNINMVNLANNHIMDFGIDGLKETMSCLEKNGIHFFGAGNNQEKAYKPCIINCGEETVAFWGFSWSDAGTVIAKKNKAGAAGVLKEKIKTAIEPYMGCDKKIAYFHFGVEFEDYPEPFLKDMIEELLEQNYLDLVLGNHPHCIQGIYEKDVNNEKKLCFYSMGNFVIPEEEYYKGRISYPEKSHVGFGVIYETETREYEMIPYKIDASGRRVEHLSLEEFEEKIAEYSKPLNQSYPEYKAFYKEVRNRKNRYVYSRNEFFNGIVFGLSHFRYIIIFEVKSMIKRIFRLFGYDIASGRKIVKKR